MSVFAGGTSLVRRPLRVSIRTLDRLRAEGRIRAIKVRSAVRIADAEIQRSIAFNSGVARGNKRTSIAHARAREKE
jgi:hypothetical protein